MEHSPLSQRPCNPGIMDTEGDQRTEKILDLTLEIICLLTGEGHMVVKNHNESAVYSNVPDGSYRPVTDPPLPSPLLEQKILQLTNQIIRLLTGEVPIRCEDVTVYLSMEEWEYVERHKELYKNILMKNNHPLNSLEDKSPPSSILSLVSLSELGAKNMSDNETANKEQDLEAKTEKRQSAPYKTHSSVPDTDSHAANRPAATDYAYNCVKEDTASSPGENLPNSALYTQEEHTQTEPPSTRIKEEADICEVIITETQNHSVSGPLQTEDMYNEGDPECYSNLVKPETSVFSIDSWNLNNDVMMPPVKCRQSTRGTEVKYSYPQCSNGIIGHSMAQSHLEQVFFHNLYPVAHKTDHTNNDQFLCTECGKCFALERNLIEHMKIHKEEKMYTCSVCGKGFLQASHLVTHQRVHTGEKPFKCDVCGKCFTRDTGLAYHKSIHTGEKPFKCDDCGKCFRIKHIFLRHQRIHSGEKPFTCTECGKGYIQYAHLLSHQRIHTGIKPFNCHQCGKGFSNETSLAVHQSVHTGEKPFKCSECGKCFRLKHFLISHQMIHTGEKPFPCSECGKCFKVKHALTVHQKSHTSEKPYKCEECGKSCKHLANLISHKRIHTQERAFECSECGSCFRNRYGLVCHQRIHTEENGLNVYNVENRFI